MKSRATYTGVEGDAVEIDREGSWIQSEALLISVSNHGCFKLDEIDSGTRMCDADVGVC